MSEPVVIQPRHQLASAVRHLEAEFGDNAPEWVAERAVAHIKRSDYRTLLLGFVTDDIRTARRREAALAEKRAYRAEANQNRKWHKQYEADKERLSASPDQHRRRADSLIGQGLGTLRTAAMHEAAIALITETGSSCLSEVRAAA